MRILLAANASYVPPRGGATRSNLVWLEHLARAGHECRVVAALLARDPQGRLAQLSSEEIDLTGRTEKGGLECVSHHGIRFYSAIDPGVRGRALREQVREFDPDWVLVSSEDLGSMLLRDAHEAAPGRVVYLAHTPQFFPFGPASWKPDDFGAELVRRSASIVAISREVAGYIESHLGRRPEVIHPPIYGRPPWPYYGAFDRGLVTMINPCAVKGIDIFLALARRFPDVSFGAMQGWGTTSADRATLESLPNIQLLPNCRNIEDFLSITRVLLMPSLWYEGFGLIVTEAMLRGVPVIASNSGGLREAKLGTRFAVPVKPIERYGPTFDEHGIPAAEVPPREIEPWADALRALLSDQQLYEQESRESAAAAQRFVSELEAAELEQHLRSLKPKLRILLAHNSTYYPAHGGGDKSNRLLVESLAARGHSCRVVARLGSFGEAALRRYVDELAGLSIPASASEDGVVSFHLNGAEVRVLANHANVRAWFAGQIEAFGPDVIIASTDDPAQLLLEPALKQERARVVYLARATLALPFGPDCAFASAPKTSVIAQADAVVGVSRYVANYIRQHADIPAVHVPISLLERGPYRAVGRFENEFVTLVNPCAVKGIAIFLELADRLPEVRFAAVPTWGTNAEDRAALERRRNVTILDPVNEIERILRRTRVLLVPSLWAEARSRIVVEAMLHGVPVIASDIGGIPEAKLGVPYLIPVRPIASYSPQVDEQMVPVASVPEQDVDPWQDALARLLSDRAHYEEISRTSRQVALAYASQISVAPFENLLFEITRAPRRARTAAAAPRASTLENLSPEKRQLLISRLKKRAATLPPNPWFPSLEPARGRLRLFCFPHAGGGTAGYHGWARCLPASVVLCPVRLPGRESRLAEAPFLRMDPLVQALLEAIRPHTAEPFAFFGHSMGAAVAFELARALRSAESPLPAALFVSGARAPQFRRNWKPPAEPSEAELLRDVQRLAGLPPEALDDPGTARLILPALRADTALYRNYVYEPGPPLPMAAHAYGGTEDPNIPRQHIEAWREQTTGEFSVRFVPGGHFFLQTAQTEFLAALAADLGR